MNKRLIKILTGIGIGLTSASVYATDLVQVFQQAYMNDPTFQSARSSYMAVIQDVPIARSALLPQISFMGSTQYNHVIDKSTLGGPTTTIPGTNRLAGGDIFGGSKFNFNSNNMNLQATQTVINFAEWAGLNEAKDNVKSANATFNGAFQSLMSRTSEAYFSILDAEDNLRFIEAQKAAIYRQLDQVQQQFKVGLVAITGVYQAQAAYDNVVAEEIAAQNNIINARENLRAITGRYYDHLAGLKGDVPLVTPKPSNVDAWVNVGVKQNWTLVASRFTVAAAKQNVNVQAAGHLPEVDAYGTIEQDRSGRSPTGHIKTNSNVIGVQLDLPIYEGGFVVASTKQARYQWQNAIDQQELSYRDTVNNVRQSYNNVISGISQIKADKQAIISNKASLESTIEAYKVGTQTMLDVLQSQQELFNTLSSFATDQYNYINALVSLKEAAGTLNINDLQKINTWLTENRRSYRFLTTSTLQAQATRKLRTQTLTPKEQIKKLTSPSEQAKQKVKEKQLIEPKATTNIQELKQNNNTTSTGSTTSTKPKKKKPSIESSGEGVTSIIDPSTSSNGSPQPAANQNSNSSQSSSSSNGSSSTSSQAYEKYKPKVNQQNSSN